MRRLAAAAAALGLSVLPWGGPDAQQVRPDIVLNKEVYRNPRLGDHVRMTHTVARGDSLWKSLTKVYGWQPEQIPEALRQVMALNPKVKNPNLIYPRQKLVVPVPVPSIPPPPPPTPAPAATPVPAATASPTPPPEPTPTPTPAPRVEIRIGLPSKDAALPEGLSGIVEGIVALFTALGQQVQHTGELAVPIDSGGTITIDASRYPVITLGGGRKLLVDLWGGIGERERTLLASHWAGGEVVPFGAEVPAREVIDRLLEASRFPRFLRKQEVVCGRKATLTMVADWQVVPKGDDLLSGERITLVNWLGAGDSPLPAEWGAFLSRFGFTLIEIGPGGSASRRGETPAPVAFDLRGMPVAEAVESLARGLGLTTRRGLSIQVSDKTGLPTPPVTIDLTVTRGRELYLLDFGSLRPEEAGLLSGYRNRLLVISPSELATHWIPRLAVTLGYRCRKVNSYFTEGGNGRAILRLSTIQLSDEKGLIVFADGELTTDLLYYLRRQGGRTGVY